MLCRFCVVVVFPALCKNLEIKCLISKKFDLFSDSAALIGSRWHLLAPLLLTL